MEEQAIKLNSRSANYVNGRGNVYAAKDQYDRAIQDCDAAIGFDPNHVAAYYNRGRAYVGKGQNEKALQDFDRAISLNPNHIMALNNRGLLIETWDPRSAVVARPMLRKAVSLQLLRITIAPP